MSWSGETAPWRAALGAGRALIRRDAWLLPVLAVLFGLAAGLQVASGAYDADFCGYPDESAHFVTSVMVGEFLRTPVERPMAFASRYYAQYPKLGIGHWPPLGYAMQGAWVLVFGSSRGAVLASLLAFSVMSAWVVYELSRHEQGRLVAAAAAAAWLANAHVQQSYEQTMMDMPAAALCLLAVLAFRGYVSRPGVATGLLFGTLACAALLVKQQAVVLALLPVAYVLVGRSPDLIRRADFWVTAIPTLLVAVPWYVLSTPIFYDNPARWAGFAGRGAPTDRLSWSLFWETGGVPIFLLSLMGLFRACVGAQIVPRIWASAWLAAAACRVLIPAMGEPRHHLFSFAAEMALAGSVIGRLPSSLMPLGTLAMVGASWGLPSTPHLGYTRAAVVLESGPPGYILLSSPNEGAIVAAAAARHPGLDGRRCWLRASKVLAEVGWFGKVYRSHVHSVEDVERLVDRWGINQVYFEVDGVRPEPEFAGLLRQMLERAPGAWQVVNVPPLGGEARLFRRKRPLAARPVTFFLPKLGGLVGSHGPVSPPHESRAGP
jgi:hypothetical protein